MKQFCVLLAFIAIAAAVPSETDTLLSSTLKFVKDCGDKSMFLCLKVRELLSLISSVWLKMKSDLFLKEKCSP